MQTTIEFLDAVRTRLGLTSDYQLAQYLCVTRNAVCKYRRRGDFLGEGPALKVAAALGLPPEHVLASIAAEKSKNPVAKKAWQTAAAAAILALGFALLPYPQAEIQEGLINTVYTLYAPATDPPETFLAEWFMLFLLASAALTYCRATIAPRRDPPLPRPIRPPRRARRARKVKP